MYPLHSFFIHLQWSNLAALITVFLEGLLNFAILASSSFPTCILPYTISFLSFCVLSKQQHLHNQSSWQLEIHTVYDMMEGGTPDDKNTWICIPPSILKGGSELAAGYCIQLLLQLYFKSWQHRYRSETQHNRSLDICDYLGPTKPSQTLDLQRLHIFMWSNYILPKTCIKYQY